MDFISAKSEADAIAEERKQNNIKLANLIVKAIQPMVLKDRKNIKGAIKALRQLLDVVPMEDKVEVLIYAFFKIM